MLADVIGQFREAQNSAAVPASSKAAVAAQTQTTSSGGSLATTILKSGFGLAPLITSLVSHFAGGDSAGPLPLVKYAMPAAIDFQAAETGSRVTAMDYDQAGMPRSSAPVSGRQDAQRTVTSPAPQITVNVQAMDARSFMDRSNDIALAVREAMLNLHSINDVVNEL